MGTEGIFHGMKSYFVQDEYGQIAPVYSVSAGLDYPGVGPEHSYLKDIGRAEYVPITDDEAVDAFEYLSRTECRRRSHQAGTDDEERRHHDHLHFRPRRQGRSSHGKIQRGGHS